MQYPKSHVIHVLSVAFFMSHFQWFNCNRATICFGGVFPVVPIEKKDAVRQGNGESVTRQQCTLAGKCVHRLMHVATY